MKKFTKNPRRLLLALLLILVIAGILALAIGHRRKVSDIPSSNPVISQTAATNDTGSNTAGNNQSTGTANKGQQSTSNTNTSSASLITPYGSFVSNHKPGQNGSPTTETSACNTTAGATCYIQFIQGDIVKKLTPQTADSNGSVIWNWDINTAGLTSGSWQIQAVAGLNGQTKTATDSMPLEVQ